MNVKLTKKTEQLLRLHIAEYEQIEPSDVSEARIVKLINQMVLRESDQCNLAEDYLE